jgi:hypothetical protein
MYSLTTAARIQAWIELVEMRDLRVKLLDDQKELVPEQAKKLVSLIECLS